MIRDIQIEMRLSHVEAVKLYQLAGKLAYENGTTFYRARGLAMLPFEANGAVQNIIMGVAAQTAGTFVNIENTSALGVRVMDAAGNVTYKGVRRAYIELVDQAITDVASGEVSYSSAIRHAMKGIADSGIRVVDYQSGYSRRLDSSIRQTVLDGVRAIATQVQEENGKLFGSDGVEVDAHNFCALDHLPFQGRQFSNAEWAVVQDGLKRKFFTFNCRHLAYPVILGASVKLYSDEQLAQMRDEANQVRTFEGKEYTPYEATQLQRQIETAVRHAKDRAVLAKAAGDDVTRRVEQAKINALKIKYIQVTQTFELPDSSNRMAVSGFSPKRPYKESE